ncbi:MAG: hypothetical protein AB7E70_13205 [Hyphomicrobiaceae bacterium]
MTMKTAKFQELLDELARQKAEDGDHDLAKALTDLAKVFDPKTNPNLDKLVAQIRRARQIKAA